MSTDKTLLDLPFIFEFLTNCYWSPGIPLSTIQKAIEGSVCFGVYTNNKQIGFARVITDKATFAYLADVFIDEKFRGFGYAKKLMDYIMEHPDLQGLRRFLLATKDAHNLYLRYGFTKLTDVTPWMQIHNPDVYKAK